MSEGPTGYTAYSHTAWGAEHGESEKWASWKASIKRADELSAGGVEFVPFSIEAGGVWGPAARKFFRECVALADDDRDVDLYHWSSTRFSRAWFDSLSVLVARGRAKVSAAAQRPTGRSEFETCNTSMSRTSIDAYSQLEVLFQRVLKFSVACLPDVSYSCVFLM